MTLVVGPIEEYFFFNGLPYFRGGMVIYPLECYHLPSDYDSIHYIIFLSSNSRWVKICLLQFGNFNQPYRNFPPSLVLTLTI